MSTSSRLTSGFVIAVQSRSKSSTWVNYLSFHPSRVDRARGVHKVVDATVFEDLDSLLRSISELNPLRAFSLVYSIHRVGVPEVVTVEDRGEVV